MRAGYLYSAMADIAALTEDKEMLAAVDRIWNNETSKKMYVQGGVGAIGDGERFGANYELPNSTAYNETCAAIANIYFNHRMFLLHGDSKYIDVLEKVLQWFSFWSGLRWQNIFLYKCHANSTILATSRYGSRKVGMV